MTDMAQMATGAPVPTDLSEDERHVLFDLARLAEESGGPAIPSEVNATIASRLAARGLLSHCPGSDPRARHYGSYLVTRAGLDAFNHSIRRRSRMIESSPGMVMG